MTNSTPQPAAENGIYYFLGNITSHALHLIPLHKLVGGTVVVLSEKAKKEIEKTYHLPVLCLQDAPDANLEINSQHAETFKYLEENAKQIIFYEIFKFNDRSLVPKKPVTFFLTHGNMLKNYMGDQTQREKSVKDYDYIAGLGPFMKNKFMSENKIPENKILDIGVARTDDILNGESQTQRKVETLNKLRRNGLTDKQTVVSYMPTYWGDSSVYNTGLKVVWNIKKEHFLIVRLHPQTKKVLQIIYKALSMLKKNVLFVPNGNKLGISLEDIYAISDVIIGDVSSVMFEAILLKKPLLFAYGSGTHRQDESTYDAISTIVSNSGEINEKNVGRISSIISESVSNKIDNKIWDKTIGETFFLCGGKCTEKIAELVQSSPKQV